MVPPGIYPLSLHDALPISTSTRSGRAWGSSRARACRITPRTTSSRSEEHTSELQSLRHLVCRLLLEKKKQVHAAWNSRNQPDMGRIAISAAIAYLDLVAGH